MFSPTKIIISFVVGVFTSVAVFLLEQMLISKYHFAVSGFSLFFILPVGAMFLGLAASSGFFVALRVLQVKKSFFHTAIGMTLGLSTFIGLQAYDFVKNQYPDISSYLKQNIGRRDFVLVTKRGKPVGFSPDKLDATYGEALTVYNYISYGLEGLGFLFGAFAMSLNLGDGEYCSRCRRYKKKKTWVDVDTTTVDTFCRDLQAFLSSSKGDDLRQFVANYKGKARYMGSTYYKFGSSYCHKCFDGGFVVWRMIQDSDGDFDEDENGSHFFPVEPDMLRKFLAKA